jgi:hypothetical protein
MKLTGKRIYLQSPRPGALVYGNSFYTRVRGGEMKRTRANETRSDLFDSDEVGYSSDHGKTWSEWQEIPSIFKEPGGTRRLWTTPAFVDPAIDRVISIVLEGLLPGDDAMDGLTNYFLRYRISEDGGRSHVTDEIIIEQGRTPDEPFDGIRIGKNSIMIGDMGSRPIRTCQGKILVPVQMTPLGPDGEYHAPPGVTSFHESAVLIGTWRADHRLIDWKLSQRVKIDPSRSTRGAIEPTILEISEGRILMILRGSNGGATDPDHQIPSYRWQTISNDGGQTWSEVRPWTYTDGMTFFSPSSCSQLLRHSSGRIVWLGNVNSTNSVNNGPRYPFVIGEVDPDSFGLVRESVVVIDDCGPGDDPSLMLSNFMAHEDRQTKEIVLHMSRFNVAKWTGDAYQYRIGV